MRRMDEGVEVVEQTDDGTPSACSGPPCGRGAICPRLTARQELWIILILALAVRLVGFTRPYISEHWIKQLQVAPIALNFHHHGYNILWPETDYSADKPGYIEIEFQLVTWLTAILYNLFGVHEWVGRLVTVTFSMIGMGLLFALMRREIGQRAATFGLLFYAFAPSSVYFSRVLMSEPAMLCFSIALVYLFFRYLETEKWNHWVGALVCGMLAFLVKLPAVHLALPLGYLAYRKYGWAMFKQWQLWAFAVLSVVPAAAYYMHAHRNIGPEYFSVGVGFGGQMWFSPHHFLNPQSYSLMLNRLLKEHLTAVGLVLLPLGVCYEWGRGQRRLFHWWLAGVLVYFVVVSGGNLRQNYYQLPLIPAAAGLIGLAWAAVSVMKAFKPGGGTALVAGFAILCVWGAQPFYEEYKAIPRSAQVLDKLDPAKHAVIVMPPGFGIGYYLKRPTWVGREDMGKPPQWVKNKADMPGPEYIEDRIVRGAKYALFFRAQGQEDRPDIRQYLESHFTKAYDDPEFEVFDLGARVGERVRQ